MLMGMLGQLEVERRIVDEHHAVGMPAVDGCTSRAHEAQNGGQMLGHLDKAHISHVAVMDDGCHACGSFHHVAAQKLELGLMIMFFDGLDQMCPVQVARCLASNEKIFHYYRL